MYSRPSAPAAMEKPNAIVVRCSALFSLLVVIDKYQFARVKTQCCCFCYENVFNIFFYFRVLARIHK